MRGFRRHGLASERIDIGLFLLWIVVLAIALLVDVHGQHVPAAGVTAHMRFDRMHFDRGLLAARLSDAYRAAKWSLGTRASTGAHDGQEPRRDGALLRRARGRNGMCSGLVGDRYVGEAPEPVRADRKDGGETGAPAQPCLAIRGGEGSVAKERFDARPGATGGEAGAERASRLVRRRMGAPRLAEDDAASNNAVTCAPTVVGGAPFDCSDEVAELRAHTNRIAELGRGRQMQGQGVRHDTVGPKKVTRPMGDKRTAFEERIETVEAGPVMHTLDKVILDRIRGGVRELRQHVGRVDETHETRRFTGPEVLPSPAKRILRPGHELVQVLGELDDRSVSVVEDRVMVVRHHNRENYLDAETPRGVRQAVQERVVGRMVGTQEKLPLRTATSEHVEGAWKYLAGR